MRLSITDRCNLHCRYCRGGASSYIPHERILRYEELLRLTRIFQRLGVNKVRVTGGEPFIRKGCIEFLSTLRDALPDTRLCVTTNGTLIEPYLADLKRIGLESINISLDSFDGEIFGALTGKPLLGQVVSNIDKLLSLGCRVKINAVAMRGITDSGLEDFIHAAESMPVDIRFIEFMPMGSQTIWSRDKFIASTELLEIARCKTMLRRITPDNDEAAGPAVMYEMPGRPGRLGFISAISAHFCKTCSRVRLTSEGKLRLCLFEDREFRLAPMLRMGLPDATIARAISNAFPRKPFGCDILAARRKNAVASKHMDGIGG